MEDNKAPERPSWDELFILMAAIMSSRGSCDRLRTACILVKNNRIVGAGYNGAVAGMDIDGSTAYVVATPCIDCMKSMLQMGVKRIVFIGSYRSSSDPAYDDYIDELILRKDITVMRIAEPKTLLEILEKTLGRLQGSGGILSRLDKVEFIY